MDDYASFGSEAVSAKPRDHGGAGGIKKETRGKGIKLKEEGNKEREGTMATEYARLRAKLAQNEALQRQIEGTAGERSVLSRTAAFLLSLTLSCL